MELELGLDLGFAFLYLGCDLIFVSLYLEINFVSFLGMGHETCLSFLGTWLCIVFLRKWLGAHLPLCRVTELLRTWDLYIRPVCLSVFTQDFRFFHPYLGPDWDLSAFTLCAWLGLVLVHLYPFWSWLGTVFTLGLTCPSLLGKWLVICQSLLRTLELYVYVLLRNWLSVYLSLIRIWFEISVFTQDVTWDSSVCILGLWIFRL